MLPLISATSITLRRYLSGTVGADGRFSKGAATDSTIIASVQSADDEDLEILPEGLRRAEGKRIYTATAIHTADQYGLDAADRLVIDSVSYVAAKINGYPGPLAHTRVIAVRLQEGQS